MCLKGTKDFHAEFLYPCLQVNVTKIPSDVRGLKISEVGLDAM